MQVSKLGRVFRSAPPVPLTESETEYVVTCVKHIFESAVVLQFNVTNTIPEQRLLNVRVTVEGGDELYSQVASIPVKTLAYGTAGACYVILARQTGLPITLESFRCELHFKVVEIDPVTGDVEGDPAGFAEEYPLEDLEISTSDFMAKVTLGDFKRNWEALGPDHEVMEKFQLQVGTPDTMWRACPSEHSDYSHCLIPMVRVWRSPLLQFKQLGEAILAVIDYLGMQPCDGTAAVGKAGATTHNLHLSGVFVGSKQVLVRCQLQLDPQAGMVLKVRNHTVSIKLAIQNVIMLQCPLAGNLKNRTGFPLACVRGPDRRAFGGCRLVAMRGRHDPLRCGGGGVHRYGEYE